MAEETRDQKVRRLTEKHIRDRNMDPNSINKHYSVKDVGIQLDPDFFEVDLLTAWGFFKDEPRHLDHMTRNILVSSLLCFRERPGMYHHARKAVEMGVTYEQLMEAYEVGRIVGGGPVYINGMTVLKRLMDEGVKPGSKPGPWAGRWVQLGPKIPIAEEKEDVDDISGTRVERILRIIEKYHPDEEGGLNKDLAFGVKRDPEFFEGFARLAWEFFGDTPRHLDPIRREMVMLMILAFQGARELVYLHTKKALRLGATVEQLLEAFEVVGCAGGGFRVLMEGLRALRQIQEEQSESKKGVKP